MYHATMSKGNQAVVEYNLMIARKAYEEAMKEEVLSKYTFPTKPSSDGFYHIYVPDSSKKSGRRQIKASTLEILRSKVYAFEKGIGGSAKKTFEEVFNLYLEDYAKCIKNEEKRYSANNTINRRRSEYKRYYKDSRFSSLYIDEITVKDIKDFLANALETHKMSKQVYFSMSGIIRVTFAFAADEGLIDTNVSILVDYKSKRFFNMFVESKSIEERMWSDEEIEVFLLECRERQAQRKKNITSYALEFQILIGARRGEVCPLKWSDISVDQNGIKYIEISKELLYIEPNASNPKGYEKIVSHTKTSLNRRVPVWKELDEFLERLWAVHTLYYPNSDFLFPGKQDEGCLGVRGVYNLFYRICKTHGYELDKYCSKGTHAFRRSFAKRIDNPEMAAKLLGNQPRILKKNYYDGLNMEKALEVLNGGNQE